MLSCFKGKVRITSPMGYRTLNGKKDYHGGVDIVGVDNTNVFTPYAGICRVLYEPDGFGTYIRLEMKCGLSLYFGHLKQVYITDYEKVKAGACIGLMGSTGYSTGAHTHLELRVSGSKTPLNIHYIMNIPEKIGLYDSHILMTKEDAVSRLKNICGIEQQTIDYLSQYKYADDLFRKIGTSILFDYI